MNYRIYMPLVLALSAQTLLAQDMYDDDIYYNPKKDTSVVQKNQRSQSNYIADFSNMDVDTYNMRGLFMPLPVDTIGAGVENGEDFIYTQEIQKYYNPTIVIDNAELLADVLNNSYGNVDIIINDNGSIGFAPWSYAWPYSYYDPWRPGWGWNWNIGFGYYDPWYMWGYGPGWGWGPGWGYGPGWYPGWTWGPALGGYRYADRTPGGSRRVGANAGWASSTRPGGGNYAGGAVTHRVSNGHHSTSGVAGATTSTGNHRVYNGTSYTGTVPPRGSLSTGAGYTINSSGHRVTGSGTGNVNRGSTTNRRTYNSNTTVTTNNNRTYNNTNTNTTTNRTYNSNPSRTYNQGGTYRGNTGSGMGSGGGARGRHR